MLKLLRKKGVAKKILWVILVVIILSFGFFGTAYLVTDNQAINHAGTLFGKKIPVSEFRKAYQDVRIQAIIRFGEKFKEVAHLLNLEAETWDRLILLHEVKKRKIEVDNAQVIDHIAQYPFFQRDGQFDPLLYNDILRYALRISAREFEEGVRDNLKFSKLFKQETQSIAISDHEAWDIFKRQNEKVQVDYILITPEPFQKDILAGDEEAKVYYAQNKNAFNVAPTISVEYINLAFPPPGEEDLSVEEGLTAGPGSESATITDKIKQPVREKAKMIFQDLLINPDMQAITQKHQTQFKSSRFFSMEQPDLTLGWSYELLLKLFQLDENTVNDPFETPQGILIVKIKEKRAAYTPEYTDVVGKVKEAVVKAKAKVKAREKTQEYLTLIQEAFAKTQLKDFAETVKNLGLEIHQSPVFSREEYLPVVGISKEFQDAAFALTDENKLSNVVETEIGHCVLYWNSRVVADQKTFDEQKASISEKLLNERRTEAFNDFITRLRLNANIATNITQ